MSPEDLKIVEVSLMLQLDIEEYLVSIGLDGKAANDAACEITHMINTSDVVKDAIKKVYESCEGANIE